MGAVCRGCCRSGSQYVPEYKKTLPSLRGKAVAITGCTTGTGRQLVDICLEKGASVFLLNRPSSRAEAALAEAKLVAKEHGAPEPKHLDCDLGSFESVRAVRELLAPLLEAGDLGGGLDVLVNNAGIMGFPDKNTVDEFEIQMQTNFLGHFVLTHDLMPYLEKAAALRGGARVVNHSSCMRKAPDGSREEQELRTEFLRKRPEYTAIGDLSAVTGTLGRTRRYQQSKLACLVFTSALQSRFTAAGSQVMALCAHPGNSFTEVFNSAVKSSGNEVPSCIRSAHALLAMTAEDGAMGILMCTADPAVEAGQFYGPRGDDDPGSGNKNHNFGEYYGPAVKMNEEPFNTKDAQDMLWHEACVGTGTGEWKFA